MNDKLIELESRINGTNDWIEREINKVNNVNMFEIMGYVLERNVLASSGEDVSTVDACLNYMKELRKDSIKEYMEEVPEVQTLLTTTFDEGLTPQNADEIELLKLAAKVPFYIYNRRKRGENGWDVSDKINDGKGIYTSQPDYYHDNSDEVNHMIDLYEKASDEVKAVTYPLVKFTFQNSILSLGKEAGLVKQMQGITAWIASNKLNIGNANMYEIMDCIIQRNILSSVGENIEIADSHLNQMFDLRKKSIEDFINDVPEASALLTAAIDEKLCPETTEEAELMKKCVSVPFFIYNSRKRGFDGDITRDGKGIDKPLSAFNHNNEDEVKQMVTNYNHVSDEIKKVTYPLVNWTLQNSIYSNKMSVEPVMENQTGMHM